MLPHQAGWQPNEPPEHAQQPDQDLFAGLAALDGSFEETLAKEIAGRIAGQQLDQALPSFEALLTLGGTSGSADGALQLPPPPPLFQPQAQLDPLQYIPAPAYPAHPSVYPHPDPTAAFSSSSQFPPPPDSSLTYPPPPPLYHPQNAPGDGPRAWTTPFSTASAVGGPPLAQPLEQSAIHGLSQLRSASNDYGQPQAIGGVALPYGQSLPGSYGALPPPPASSSAYPSSLPYPSPQSAVTPTMPQGGPTMQTLFKQYWQRQDPPSFSHPTNASPSLEVGPAGSPSGGHASTWAREGSTYFPPPPQWPTPLATPQHAQPPYLPSPDTVYPTQQSAPLTALPQQLPSLVDPSAQAHLDAAQDQPPLPQGLALSHLSALFPPASAHPTLPTFPQNPTSLRSTPSSSSATPNVDFAASNAVLAQPVPKRSRTTSTAQGASGTALARPPASRPPPKSGKKLTVDLAAACMVCTQPIARLILRGKASDLDVPHAPAFTCTACTSQSNSPESGESPEAEPQPSTSKRRSSTRATQPKATVFRKKNKRLDSSSALTSCDVCLRDVATGGVLPTPLDNPPPTARIDFMVEVVCVSCDSKYRRCTDCGGGGGVRAGTGKWRCKELFPQGRKTCCLNHQRLGAFTDMEFDVYNIRDIPADELDDISTRCGQLFVNQMLAGICIPEVLEGDGAIWANYEQAHTRATQGWSGLDPIMRYDIEDSTSIRRYLALRTCTPNLRKNKQKAELEEELLRPKKVDPVVLQNGRDIAGLILAEYELNLGHVFLALVIPWDPTGETFDATTLLIGALVKRVDEDCKAMNAERAARGEELLPELTNVWTMLFFKKESRMLGHLIKKREFLFIDDFMKKYPETNRELFPPHRPCYIPLERQAGWQILVRRQKHWPEDPERFDDWNARRTVDEARGKKKELKARQAKAVQDSGN
ncbi:hypothetical protein JCM10207_000239 [Rhodosporidiobolus poonsookiae]